MIDPHKANYGGTPVAPWRKKLPFAAADGDAPPLLSIITPFYEGAPLFRETVQSVIGQSLQRWEWLIVDDGSTGAASLGCLYGLANEDPRIRVIRHPENRGRSHARNTGLRAASTEFLYPLDQDDLLEPTALEKSLWYLRTHPEHAFANGWCVGFGAQSYLWDRGFDREDEFLVENQVSGRALIRRWVYDEVGDYDESLRDGYEDWDFWLRCAERGIWGGTIPEYLEWFRRKSPPASWEDPARVAEIRARLRERHPRLVDGAFPKTVHRADPVPPAPDLLFENRLAPHPRRILLLAGSLDFQSDGALMLGAAEVLAKQGWQLTVAVATERDGAACEQAFGRLTADVHVLDRFLASSEQPRFLRYLVESRGPAAVLCEATHYGRVMAAWLRASCPAPLYAELVHDDPNRAEPVAEPLRDPSSQSPFDAAIATTRALAETLRGESRRVEHVPPAIDTTAWKPRREPRRWLRPHWGAGDGDLVVLFTGRFGERSRPRVLCRTLLELARRKVPFRAVLQGDGEDGDWIRAFLARHGLEERVRIEATPSPDWMLKSMAASDVFLAPSRDGLPVLLLRAMSMGLPVVAAASDALCDAVDAEVGIAIEARGDDDEVAGYADALQRLAEDEALRRTLARGARRRVLGRFGPDWIAARMIELLSAAERSPRSEDDTGGAFARAVECAALFARADERAREGRALARIAGRQADRIRDLESWNDDQARARSWLEAQARNWEEIAKQREDLLAKRDRWIQDLDKARKWLEGQREHFQKLSQDHAQHATQALEHAKVWQRTAEEHTRRIALTEEQCERWRLLAEDHAARIAALEGETAALREGTAELRATAARLQADNEQLATEQVAVARRLAALARRWWPAELRRGAAEASRKLLAAERVDR